MIERRDKVESNKINFFTLANQFNFIFLRLMNGFSFYLFVRFVIFYEIERKDRSSSLNWCIFQINSDIDMNILKIEMEEKANSYIRIK